MSTIRTAAIASLATIVLAIAVYFAAVPPAVQAAEPAAGSCQVMSVGSLSIDQLWELLDARYLYRVGLPR